PQLKRIVSVRSLNGKEGGERAAKKGCSQDIATTVALHGTGAAHQNAPRHEPKWTRAGSFSRSRQSRCRTGPIREPPVAPWPEPRTGRCARFIAGPVEETWQDEVPVLCSSLCAESGHWSSLVPYALNSHCAAGAWHGRGLVCYASSGKEGNRRLPEHALYDLRSVARRRARPAASAALNSAGPVCAYALISPCAAGWHT